MEKLKTLFPALAVALVVVTYFSVFTVSERQVAIQFRLGEIVRADFEPGLYFKVPVLHNVRKFDARIHTAEAEPERYLTIEKKNVIVDSFVKWRIKDAAEYFRSMGGDETRASLRLYQIVKDGLRGEFGKRTMQEVISGDRAEIMKTLTVAANQQAHNFGIEVIDVRLRRVDLPTEVSHSVFQRMQAERELVARNLRARGAEAAERIRSDADRQRTVILADAYREAEHARGEGDAQAAAIYARAFGSDPEFYSLYRSLNAYKNTFRDKSDVLVMDPNSEFFKYFKNPGAQGKP